ncbi:16S rRNA (guanine(527)-N(7))-methyltransferase RsmG [Candidatus Dependentiae bacterium]|nr:16S rRNA (guanine(527)-N(7))-methyltransferase RsmG [Candidatus Dependentiae bacterium]
MSISSKYDFKTTGAWRIFVNAYQISEKQQVQFEKYGSLLLEENEKYNITAITLVSEIVEDHFFDSLAPLKLYPMSEVKNLVDVGSGGGFPGIPLAIMCPNVQFNLVEVNLKKVYFLNLVVQELGLENVTVHTYDWRTFLRKYKGLADLFIARASLQVDELLRIFKPSSQFKSATFIYWASKKWVPTLEEKEYLNRCLSYMVGQKERQLCFFSNSNKN